MYILFEVTGIVVQRHISWRMDICSSSIDLLFDVMAIEGQIAKVYPLSFRLLLLRCYSV